MSRWHPHVTVATVVPRGNAYLMVEERDKTSGKMVFNQPAGHLEANESLIDAAKRETLEETAWQVDILALLGLSLFTAPANGITYYRHSFLARPDRQLPGVAIDGDITAVHWLDYEEIVAMSDRMRSPLVLQAIAWHRAGRHYPLALLDS